MWQDAELKRDKLDPNVDWVEHLGPKTFGKHKLLLLRFWEMMFGPLNCQTVRLLLQRSSTTLSVTVTGIYCSVPSTHIYWVTVPFWSV